MLKGNTQIGTNCTIGSNSIIEDSIIGDSTVIDNSHCYHSTVASGCEIGPFVRIRPGCVVKDKCRVGNFVELKNSNVDSETKISHLSYIGDSDVGSDVNIGCGCATVNFNGVEKNRTLIGNGAFIGCGTNLVAPVALGTDSYIAAGSTIVEDVPDHALAIARTRQVVKADWVKKKKPYKRMR
ncbi:Bifunctional protein GlmU [bioreactor metagenome]|uniref:UDP-N-acetylglucosamine diphosphorylase n=1 Tax=bioreactor metagenome TaxID=1076179 RepID=A0A645G9Z1_9ZZZZ